MKVIVTGASGLLGKKVAELMLARGYKVFSIYKDHPVTLGTAVKLDLTDGKSVNTLIHKLKPEAIIHSAAYTDVDGCEDNRKLAWQINAEATKHIAVASAKVGAHLIYISTDYVFDGEKGYYREEDIPNPINYYGYTKLKGEEFVQEYAKSWCIARTSVIYGWGGSKLNFATWVIDNLKRGKEVKVLTDQYVSPTLNTNLAQMLLEIAERKLSGILHTVGATRVSRWEFALKLVNVFNLDAKMIKQIKMDEFLWRAKRPKDSSLDASKCSRILAKSKPMKIEEALEAMKFEGGGKI
jgi:dTDP-4-dehydrorhamnose reductase